MTEPSGQPEEISRWHRAFAPAAFNHTWTLLDESALDLGLRALLQVSLDYLHGTNPPPAG